MYKVVVSDLDGTLLNSDQEVSELSKKVIRELLKKGIRFYIATGRAYPDAKQIMESIGIKIPLITANGGVINDKEGNEIYRNNLLVGSKEFNILSESPFDSLKSDERRRKSN